MLCTPPQASFDIHLHEIFPMVHCKEEICVIVFCNIFLKHCLQVYQSIGLQVSIAKPIVVSTEFIVEKIWEGIAGSSHEHEHGLGGRVWAGYRLRDLRHKHECYMNVVVANSTPTNAIPTKAISTNATSTIVITSIARVINCDSQKIDMAAIHKIERYTNLKKIDWIVSTKHASAKNDGLNLSKFLRLNLDTFSVMLLLSC